MFRKALIAAVSACALLCASIASAQQPTGGINLRGAYPMDTVSGSTWSFVGGVAALTKKWANGPLFDVIGKDGAIHTINAVDGYPDVKKLAGLMGINYKVGIYGLLCTKVYDQSGNGHDATAASPANTNQPGLWLINGKVYFGFGGILTTNAQNQETAQYFTFPAGVTQNTQSNSIFAIVSQYTSSDATSSALSTFMALLYAPDAWVGGLGTQGYGSAGDTVFQQTFDLTGFSGPSIDSPPGANINTSVFSAIMGPSASTMWLNEATATHAAMTAGSGSFAAWGNDTGTPPFNSAWGGRVTAMMISSTVFTTPQAAQIRQALYQWGNVITQTPKINIVIDGASIDQNQGGDPSIKYNTQNGGGYGWAEMLKDYLASNGYSFTFSNNGVSGFTLRQLATAYPNSTAPIFNSTAGVRNVYFGFNSAVGNTIGVGSTNTNSFTATVSSGVMNVTTAPTGSAPAIQKGMAITGTGVPGGVTVSSFGTGTGGTGTYNLSSSFSVGSETLTATYTGAAAYQDFLVALAAVKAQSWSAIVTYLFPSSSGPVFDYNTLMLANASANGITCIMINNNNNPGATSADGIHPSVIGYQGYLSSLLPQLIPIIL